MAKPVWLLSERYFIEDKEAHKEPRNPYYKFRDTETVARKILEEFGLDPNTAHIVNGHTPVKAIKGESPVKANGKVFVIDGGMSVPYRKETGLAGYTLIYNSYSLTLVEHKQFESVHKAITEDHDIISNRIVVENHPERIRVADTDLGEELQKANQGPGIIGLCFPQRTYS